MKDNKKIINTNIRLNLENEADRKAWAYLQNLDRTKYKSYSKAVVTALNDCFDRQNKLEADPYLETRKKEDMFLQRVVDTIRQCLNETAPVSSISSLLKLISVNQEQSKVSENTNDDNNAALDFADNF